ncbi:hypothetical protein ACH4Y0_37755 [Streptomyces sp. NPDC020707]|uniref:hypothetical protein n=1 Tax=Streptomyces sp. NPDC020707 TaxID=3365084 RepID=UPI0037B92DCE
MIDPLPASGRFQRPGTGYDANIPRDLRGQTRVVSAWAGTLQFSAFLALVVLPLILVTEALQAPAGAALMVLVSAATRHSCLRYLRVRLS